MSLVTGSIDPKLLQVAPDTQLPHTARCSSGKRWPWPVPRRSAPASSLQPTAVQPWPSQRGTAVHPHPHLLCFMPWEMGVWCQLISRSPLTRKGTMEHGTTDHPCQEPGTQPQVHHSSIQNKPVGDKLGKRPAGVTCMYVCTAVCVCDDEVFFEGANKVSLVL